MLKNTKIRNLIGTLVLSTMIVGFTNSSATAGDCCSSGKKKSSAGHSHSSAGHSHSSVGSIYAQQKSSRGGQISQTNAFRFEVVYQPKETRIYLYDRNQKQLNMQGVNGEVEMLVNGNDKVFRYPIKYNVNGYLAVSVDLSRIRDYDMQVTYFFGQLPSRAEPTASFKQTFALTRQKLTVTPQKLTVTIAKITKFDKAGIARQKTCPVTDTSLGDHGSPIKLMVGNQPLYVCCKGCVGKVKSNPKLYLAKVSGGR